MVSSFNLYPTIDESLVSKLGIHHTGLNLSYNANEEEIELVVESEDSTGLYCSIADSKNVWDPDGFVLNIQKEYIISNPVFLFGGNGVCPKDGKVGLAMIWSCKGTNSRGVIPVGEIMSDTAREERYTFRYSFPSGSLRNSLDLEFIAYLKSKGRVRQNNEEYLAEIEGVTLGTLDRNRIIIDGNASVFPIVTVDEPSQPLWWVNLDYEDPTEDPFSAEFVSVKINKAHKNYKKLETEEGISGNPLLVEIMASAVQIIINDLKGSPYWDNIISKNQIDQGSIGEAVHYIMETYELNGLSEDRFARTLRMKLGER